MVTIDVEPARAEESSGEARTTEVTSVPFVVPMDAVRGLPVAQLPDRLLLGSVADGRLRVQEPFSVLVRREDGTIVVEAEEISELGYGTNLTEAIRDLQRAIVELYFRLQEDQSRLGTDLGRVRRRLDSILLYRRP